MPRRLLVILLVLAAALARADEPPLAARVRDAIDASDPRRAIALLDPALAKKPEDAELLALRGEARLDLGRIRDARTDLEKAARAGAAKKVAGMRARIEFLYANDNRALELLEQAPADDLDRQSIPLLVGGPFAAALGELAPIASSRTSHYLVYSDVGLDEVRLEKARKALAAKAKLETGAGVLEVGRLLETAHSAYEKVFPFERDPKLVHRVYVFAKRADYVAFARSLEEDMEDADGFYRSDVRILVVDGEDDSPEKGKLVSPHVQDTIFHEGFHQFARLHVPDLPVWLDEGLAEYFGPSRVLPSGKLDVGVIPRQGSGGRSTRFEDIREALEKRQAMPLGRFLTLEDEKLLEGDLAVVYAQAWSVVHFLVSTPRRALVVDYVKALRAGKGREAAFAQTFGKVDLDELDREWRKYVKGL